jgi:hypothetical protein
MFRSSVKTNIAWNYTLRRRSSDDYKNASAIAYYEAPLPVYPVPATAAASNAVSAIGTTGDWKFAEILENDSVSILSLRYKDEPVHVFLST